MNATQNQDVRKSNAKYPYVHVDWECPKCGFGNAEYLPLPVNPICGGCNESFCGLEVYPAA